MGPSGWACGRANGRVCVQTGQDQDHTHDNQDIDAWTPPRFLRRHSQRGVRRQRLRQLLLWSTGALLLWGFLFAEDGLISLSMRYWKIRQLQQRVATLEQQRDWLQAEIQLRQDDPATLERIAREEYGMIFPGEQVVRIRDIDEGEARRFEKRRFLTPPPDTASR